MTAAAAILLALPCIYWTGGVGDAPAIKAAGIDHLCVPPEEAEAWREAGLDVTPLSDADVAARDVLPPPGVEARPGVASPTRAPWIVANGWRFRRNPTGRYVYDLPAGTAVLGMAEAFAYGADAVLKIDSADLPDAGGLLAFLRHVPALDLSEVADFAVVDDGSPLLGEVLNLLVRRNLLFERVREPDPDHALNVQVGTAEYPEEAAADPSAFALRIRRELTDPRRSLRIYGSEVVIARLAADGRRARVHLLNYGRRPIDGLRVRVRGEYPDGHAYVAGAGRVALVEHVIAEGATEFSLPALTSYAVVDLTAGPR